MNGLDRALSRSGLSQAAFAAALGTSASRFSTYRSGRTMPTAAFFLRAQRIASSLEAARQRGWMTPPQARDAVASALDEGDAIWAYRLTLQFRDHLRELLATEPGLSGAWEAAPRSTGYIEWDALLAALAAHEFETTDREAPRWARDARLDHEWLLGSPLLDDVAVRRETPYWLAERGIFVAERDLVTA